jgi:uncharacterized protein (TIGR04255 family)
MTQFPHLRKAPIMEAVIDFRVVPAAGITVQALINEIAHRGNLGYLHKGFVVRSEFGFSLKVDAEPQVAHEGRATSIGVRLHSADERYVAQLSVEGFTLSRLAPYETWEDLVSEARRLWRGYTQCVGPGEITRIATRYINNLHLPFVPNLGRFLKLQPNIPEGFPEALSEFLQRYVLYDAEGQATVIVTEALAETSPEKPLPVILDIDAFRSMKVAVDDANVWSYLEQLRTLKNRIFYSCLTEAGLELYL